MFCVHKRNNSDNVLCLSGTFLLHTQNMFSREKCCFFLGGGGGGEREFYTLMFTSLLFQLLITRNRPLDLKTSNLPDSTVIA